MAKHENGGEDMLISRARNGDGDAFEALVRKYQRRIYAFCHRMTGTHQSADDITQETFIKAYNALSRFQPGRNFFPWIRKIALNSALNHIKVRRRESPLGDRVERVPAGGGSGSPARPEDMLEHKQLSIEFRKALDSLPESQKAVFVLKVHEDLNYREISGLLNIPVGTVMSRLNRARRILRRSLADYIEGGSR